VSASSSNGTAGSALSLSLRKHHAILHKWFIVCSLFVAENNGDDWANLICSCWYAFDSSRREDLGRCVAFRLMMCCSFHHIDSDDAVMIVGD
jgi:hypothetical protein